MDIQYNLTNESHENLTISEGFKVKKKRKKPPFISTFEVHGQPEVSSLDGKPPMCLDLEIICVIDANIGKNK